ncbi:hypothetical protein LRR18_10575 [Mangrovimonas sp. AS39]|uniref:hypothetical protein n=1 Tax=Mangrovimonas futianensis TaxID=2895523 RepID=UPI001E594361|nr:hypothetical protein [Mangrovimonas futianensis]MCF1192027.1 hypothetical protein [Mangrovimonas futianensis]MCF1195721.1 hypothetical protein [Mangrovimonas futianensis]
MTDIRPVVKPNKLKKAIVIMLLTFAISCGGEKIMIRNAEKGHGYILASITLLDGKPKFNNYGLEFKPEGKEIGLFDSNGGLRIQRDSQHYKTDNSRVYLILKELKVGNYEFFDYHLIQNFGYSASHIRSKKEFSIPFSVQEDSINYIGDFTFYPQSNDNGNLFVISDKYDRDIMKLKEKYPRINWEIVQNKALENGVLNESLIEFK